MITAADETIGNIINKLKMSPAWERTVVIFLSDNGSPVISANHPFRGLRGMLQEGAVRVPAFITSPKINVTGRRIDNMIHMTDIFPTVLDLAGNIQFK